jgi:hypothetical protein
MCSDSLINRGSCPLLNSEKKVKISSPSFSNALRWDRMRVSETDSDQDNTIQAEFDLMQFRSVAFTLSFEVFRSVSEVG